MISCSNSTGDRDLVRPELEVKDYKPLPSDLVVSRAEYKDKLYGFWLGQCIANWTGLVTEMDKIGNIGDKKTGDFYTRDDWGEPGRPSFALEMAYLPVRTTARMEAADIAEFYIVMHSLAAVADNSYHLRDQVFQIAAEARNYLPDNKYPALMFDYVMEKYKEGISWEQARDSVYIRYQVEQKDGYHITSDSLYCNGCFAAGINFAAGMISLLYGEGDIAKTIKIGALTGWDSDNPTATWGGLLGFMIGKEGIEDAFGRKFSGRFNIHRTRQNFPENGTDNFNNMAEAGIHVTDRVVQEELEGGIDTIKDVWYIPGK